MVRLGIVGIGTIATDYIELISQGKVCKMELTALCSRSKEKVTMLNEKFGLKSQYFSDYAQMLASGCIDAVLICTPHGEHPRMARMAAEAGIHILVEKPVGIYAEEVEGVLECLSQSPELVCGVMYNRRASKAYRFVKEYLSQTGIGELVRCTWIITNLYRTNAYYASGSWRGSWGSEGGGILMTQASHQLDLMQWLCGMPAAVTARCSTVNRPIQVENEAELFLEYENGAHGHFLASAHECLGTNRLEICGTRGRITVTDDSLVEILRLDVDEREHAKQCRDSFAKTGGAKERYTFDDSDNKIQQAATIQNFIDAVSGKTDIQCSLKEGLGSLQIIHGAYVSSWRGRPVSIPVSEEEFMRMIKQFDGENANK